MKYVGDCIVLYDHTPEDSVRFLKAIVDGLLPIEHFTDLSEVFDVAIRYQDLTVLEILLDHLGIAKTTGEGKVLSLHERIVLWQLLEKR